ncbi:hypothetical protein OH76DRAFT_1065544 [Lentinus brumalis]|uniref:Uncharacterized protein n=1 Tax=Lentinus brumalis TaxID=2498619 RepID=A0A371DNN5_9APHY|nr:hypothetical protein OH76DRAFT_1065544 [Polyporus brumalis]
MSPRPRSSANCLDSIRFQTSQTPTVPESAPGAGRTARSVGKPLSLAGPIWPAAAAYDASLFGGLQFRKHDTYGISSRIDSSRSSYFLRAAKPPPADTSSSLVLRRQLYELTRYLFAREALAYIVRICHLQRVARHCKFAIRDSGNWMLDAALGHAVVCSHIRED